MIEEAVTSSDCCGQAISEIDIPGASLSGREPNTLTVPAVPAVPALKRWLQCRSAPTKDKKAQLVER